MSINFSANQYQKSFKSNCLLNWEIPDKHDQRPRAYDGFTQILSNECGHLLPDIPRSKKSPWGNFVGTWDMPTRIPGNGQTNPTSRRGPSAKHLNKLKDEYESGVHSKIKKAPGSNINQQRNSASTDKRPESQITPQLNSSPRLRSGAKNPSPQNGFSKREETPNDALDEIGLSTQSPDLDLAREPLPPLKASQLAKDLNEVKTPEIEDKKDLIMSAVTSNTRHSSYINWPLPKMFF